MNHKKRVIKGRVFSGMGQGAFFTQLDWVKGQCLEKLGFVPFAGTLNIRVGKRYLGLVQKARAEANVDVVPPGPDFCPANAIPVSISNIKAAIIVPHAERFTEQVHAGDTIEVIAPLQIKKALAIEDGDEVTLVLE